jgi:hypothetical protein
VVADQAAQEAAAKHDAVRASYTEKQGELRAEKDAIEAKAQHLGQEAASPRELLPFLQRQRKEAHNTAGRARLTELRSTYDEIQATIARSRDEYSHALAALSALRLSVPDELAEWPDVAAEDACLPLYHTPLTRAERVA